MLQFRKPTSTSSLLWKFQISQDSEDIWTNTCLVTALTLAATLLITWRALASSWLMAPSNIAYRACLHCCLPASPVAASTASKIISTWSSAPKTDSERRTYSKSFTVTHICSITTMHPLYTVHIMTSLITILTLILCPYIYSLCIFTASLSSTLIYNVTMLCMVASNIAESIWEEITVHWMKWLIHLQHV